MKRNDAIQLSAHLFSDGEERRRHATQMLRGEDRIQHFTLLLMLVSHSGYQPFSKHNRIHAKYPGIRMQPRMQSGEILRTQ